MEEEIINKSDKKQVIQEKKKIKAWLMKVLPSSYDVYDLEAKYDSDISYLENKNIIAEELREMYHGEFLGVDKKEMKEIVESQQARLNAERDAKIEKEVTEYNKKDYTENKKLDQYYSGLHRAINKLCQGYSTLAFIKGRGGTGKSRNIRKALIDNKVKFYEIAGDVTEAYLYRLFFEHNGEVIWLRDTTKILSGRSSINLLKASTETESVKLLTKSNYSKDQDDLPDRFIFKGKIVFDYNEITGIHLKEDFEALKSRGDYVNVSFCIEEIKQIMLSICKEPWQIEVTNEIIKDYEWTGQELLNLRTQWKAFKTYEYALANNLDWKSEIKSELQNSISNVKSLLYPLIGTKVIRTRELKKLMLRYEIVKTVRTADNKVNAWLLAEEIYKWSEDDRNFYISIVPKPNKSAQQEYYNE